MKRNLRRLGAIGAMILLLCTCMTFFQGCDSAKAPGMEQVDTSGYRFLLMTVDSDQTEIVVRRLEKDKENDQFFPAQEYTPSRITDENAFGLSLETGGIYEVVATASDGSTVTHTVEVDEPRLYVLDMTNIIVHGQ